jgi:hypothetical protein
LDRFTVARRDRCGAGRFADETHKELIFFLQKEAGPGGTLHNTDDGEILAQKGLDGLNIFGLRGSRK